MIRLLLLSPFLLVLVAFALSNDQVVRFGLWPTDLALEAPLGPTVLGIAGVFFVLGALLVWLPALGHRSRARRAERKVTHLETKLKEATATPGVKLISGPKAGRA